LDEGQGQVFHVHLLVLLTVGQSLGSLYRFLGL
jgi:hypothetical protein